jgi:uncharacterized membrane protein
MADTRNPVSSANLMGHPLHPILITLPIGLFAAVLFFDLIFWFMQNDALATGALWLLGAGLVAAALAAVTGLIDFLGDRRIRDLSDSWQHAIGNVVLVLIQLFSFYQRYRYGTSAVVPLGLVLSLIAVGIMLFTGERRRDGLSAPRSRIRRAALTRIGSSSDSSRPSSA